MKKGKWPTLLLVCLVLLLMPAALRADDSYNTKVHMDQGGDQLSVDSGGKIVVASGGTIEVQSGGTLTAVDWAAVDTNPSLGTSATKVPSQGAVKSYVDTGLGTKANTSHTQLATSITGVVEDIAIDTTLVAAQAGEIITNTGANASKTFTLPTPAKGLIYTVVKVAAQNLKVVAGSGAILGTTNNSLVTTTAGSALRIIGVSTTQWSTLQSGTWTDTTVLP